MPSVGSARQAVETGITFGWLRCRVYNLVCDTHNCAPPPRPSSSVSPHPELPSKSGPGPRCSTARASQGWNQVGDANWQVTEGAIQATRGNGSGSSASRPTATSSSSSNSGSPTMGTAACISAAPTRSRSRTRAATRPTSSTSDLTRDIPDARCFSPGGARRAGERRRTLENERISPRAGRASPSRSTACGWSTCRTAQPHARADCGLQYAAGTVKFLSVRIRPLEAIAPPLSPNVGALRREPMTPAATLQRGEQVSHSR